MTDSVPQKVCRDCDLPFPATTDFFYPSPVNKDGLLSQCIPCRSKYMSERYALKHPKPEEPTPPPGQKFCIRCTFPKPADRKHFPLDRRTEDGLSNICRKCKNARDKERVEKVIEVTKGITKPIDPSGKKSCIDCGELKEINEKNFRPKPTATDGFYNVCRVCMNRQDTERTHARHQASPPTFSEDVEKVCLGCDIPWPATPDYFDRNKRKPDGLDSQCKVCKKERGKEYRLNNADALQWRAFMYRQANREGIREKGQAYDRAHRAEINARMRVRDAQIRESEIHFTAQDVLLQYSQQEGTCYWCHCILGKYHVDHIIPVTRGGSDDPSNIVLSCPFCNQSKGKKTVEEWLKYLEKFILRHPVVNRLL